ncbi:MAG: hypothetical protein MZU95_12230 [Desulfomicrobium escambiense]|nr:hypothetical protein [Desulfomicrobium escambiense]
MAILLPRPNMTKMILKNWSDFIVANKIEIPVISVLTPMPGTPLYEKMKKDIIISDLDYYTFTNAVTKHKMPEALFYKTYR